MSRFRSFRAFRSSPVSPSLPVNRTLRRYFSIKPDRVNPEAIQKPRARLIRLTSRLPRFLQRYTTPLINAPLTHISAFLLLHELTAIVPLFTLTGIFHYTQWLPPYISEGKWVSNGVEMFGSYFRRKGWLGDEDEARRYRWWGRGEGGVRVVVEFATAYAVTKALLPVRLVVSVSATPWFARIAIVPFTNMVKRVFGKGGRKPPSSGSGGPGNTVSRTTKTELRLQL